MIDLGKKPALLIVDMQNAFCNARGHMNRAGLDYRSSAAAVAPVGKLLTAARAAGIPIVFTRYSLNADYSDAGLLLTKYPQLRDTKGLIRGSWDADIVPELAPGRGEVIIDKTRYTAFYGTDLEARLRALEVDLLIVCGVTTNSCVESTIRDAFFRDFRVVVPSEATAAVTPEFHEGALRNFQDGFGDVTSVSQVVAALSGLRQPSG